MVQRTKDIVAGDKPAQDRTARPAARGSVGSTVLGILIGMALGLGIAAVVAIYVTRAPVPFVNKLGRSGERIEAAKAGGELADPNKPLAGKPRAGGSPDAAASDMNSILNIFKDAPQVPPDGQAPAAPARAERVLPAPGAAPPAGVPRAPDAGRGGDSSSYPSAAPSGAAPSPAAGTAAASTAAASASTAATAAADAAKASSSYLLQAGAFRGQDDADSMRAKLALLGFEARVLPAEVEGRPVYRVRVGPYGQLEDMNRARAKLAENGIEATVIRQR